MALDAELARAWPEKDSPFTYEQAEKLPYLVSTIRVLSSLSDRCSIDGSFEGISEDQHWRVCTSSAYCELPSWRDD